MLRRPRTVHKPAPHRRAATRRAAVSRRAVAREVVEVVAVVIKRGWLDRVRDWLQSFYGTFGVDIARL